MTFAISEYTHLPFRLLLILSQRSPQESRTPRILFVCSGSNFCDDTFYLPYLSFGGTLFVQSRSGTLSDSMKQQLGGNFMESGRQAHMARIQNFAYVKCKLTGSQREY